MTVARLRIRILFVFAVFLGVPLNLVAQERCTLLMDGPVSGPAALALGDLEQAIMGRGIVSARRTSLPDEKVPAVAIGIAGESATVDRLLKTHAIVLPPGAESLCVRKVREAGRPILLVAGRDARGLGYAILDIARAIETAPKGQDVLAAATEAVESPYLRSRSMTVHLFNADLEAVWYFDEEYWRDYFAMLARNRFNHFTLTFSDQTNYLTPLYAYLVDTPSYPDVRARGVTAADRRRNLHMLGRIAELARARGIDFTLGIWMQAPVPAYSAEVKVEGLPTGLRFAEYCAEGLRRVLEACPAISGVQFRMNAESGVTEEMQTEVFRIIFRAIRACGRPIRLDLRFKGLQEATLAAARALGFDVAVSFKFWCEHMGLPYHPTVEDKHYRQDRYGFGNMLRRPRDYRVLYQLWSVGSSRVLLWGDPDYAARFARACKLGDGDGFEVFAPLTNKGFGDQPGTWKLFADRKYEVGRWEHERYWFFYLCFGRLGYNPDASPAVWRREFQHRFGEAADEFESAYQMASQVLPFLTAARSPSAGEWRWWPEMDTGGQLPEYIRTQPGDTAQFYAIRSWQRTKAWPWETWDETIPGYAEDAARGRVGGKMSPFEVSRHLGFVAFSTETLLDAAQKKRSLDSPELRGTDVDLRVLAALARYHAEKTVAATHLALSETTGDRGRLPPALEHMRLAADAWQRIVTLTDGVYSDNLVFGVTKGSPQTRSGRHHSGHWKDRLAEVRADVAALEAMQKGAATTVKQVLPDERGGSNPKIEHKAIEETRAGRDLPVTARVDDPLVRRVILHYRPLDQTLDWAHLDMRRGKDDRWDAVIPGKGVPPHWDLQYYFEAVVEGGGGGLWPSWTHGLPYIVVRVSDEAPAKAGAWNDHPVNEWVRQSPRDGKPAPAFGWEGSGDFDPFTRRWIHFGGHDGVPQGFALFAFDPVGGGWEQRFPNVSPPGVCCVDGAAAFDTAKRRFVRFPGASLGHGYQWSRAEKLKGSPVWLYDSVANTWEDMRPPPYRPYLGREGLGQLNAAAAYDPNHELSWSFGGQNSAGGTNNLFAYDAAANQLYRMESKGAPSQRDGMGLAYDTRNDCLVMFGSQYGSDEKTWIYRPRTGAWEAHDLDPHPPGKKLGTYSTIPRMAYDSRNGVCLCVTWDTDSGMHQTWALDVARMRWTRMNPKTEASASMSRSRNLGYWPEQNVFLLETSSKEGRGKAPEIWTYRYAQVADDPRPAPPADLRVATDKGAARLSWSAGPASVKGYNVYRANIEKPWQTEFREVASVAGTSFEDRALAAGVFAYRVTARSSDAESLPSVQARTQPAVPHAPIVSVLSPERIELRWQPHPAADVVGYNLYRGVVQMRAVKQGKPTAWRDNDPEYAQPMPVEVRDIVELAKVNVEPLTATTFTDLKVDLRRSISGPDEYRHGVYAYIVKAVNRLGTESGPSPYALTLPSAPANVLCREQGTTAELKWDAAPENAIAGYHVYKLGKGVWDIVRVTTEPIQATTFRHEAGKGTTRYWVVAVDSLGQEGEPSSPAWCNHRYPGFYPGEWHQ